MRQIIGIFKRLFISIIISIGAIIIPIIFGIIVSGMLGIYPEDMFFGWEITFFFLWVAGAIGMMVFFLIILFLQWIFNGKIE